MSCGLRPGVASVHLFRPANYVAREVAEPCLAHAVADATEAAYARSEGDHGRRSMGPNWLELLANRTLVVGGEGHRRIRRLAPGSGRIRSGPQRTVLAHLA